MTDVELIKSLNERIQRNRGDVDAFDALIAVFERNKRWSEMVRTLEAKAEVVEDVDDRVALWCRAATCFIDRFANQREAIRLWERVLELQPGNRRVIDQMVPILELRRDHERLQKLRATLDG